MQSSYTGHVARSEWWWVTLISITLLLLSFMPFIITTFVNSPDANWRFMGALHDYENSAAYITRIEQGADGKFLLNFLHTPEAHSAILIQPIYPLLGQLSRLVVRSSIVVFHIARMFAAFFMYLAIYQLAANIWVRVRTRRIFFALASVGSGFGWFLALVTGLNNTSVLLDLMAPQAFPFYSTVVNVHYPLTIACLALLAGVLLQVFRPGITDRPTVGNGGAIVLLCGLIITFIYPESLLPISIAFLGSLLAQWIIHRHIAKAQWHWGLWLWVPSLPILAYYLLLLSNNAAFSAWLAQRSGTSPSIFNLIFALGLLLILSLPGLRRALTRFEPDGDRFMLLWLFAMLVLLYLPLPIRQLFLAGLTLPLAYFGTRAAEDFWFQRIKRRYRSAWYVAVLPSLALSQLFVLFVPLLPVLQGWTQVDGKVLEPGYVAAFTWLDERSDSGDVLLAAPDVAPWIPVWVGSRVVYGHPTETIDAAAKAARVRRWYAATDVEDAHCQDLLDEFRVQYVVVGPREKQLGTTACTSNLVYVASFNQVDIYSTQTENRLR